MRIALRYFIGYAYSNKNTYGFGGMMTGFNKRVTDVNDLKQVILRVVPEGSDATAISLKFMGFSIVKEKRGK